MNDELQQFINEQRDRDPIFRKAYDRHPEDPTLAYANGVHARLLADARRESRVAILRTFALTVLPFGAGLLLGPARLVGTVLAGVGAVLLVTALMLARRS